VVSRFDAVCAGESMALVTPDPARPLAEGGPALIDVAGAESTVACYLAGLGARVAWASRVGDDPLGALLRNRIGGYGVDTTLVDVDPDAPTGAFFKDPGAAVYYYRAGSAASRLGPELWDRPELAGCRLIHLSGITPALSPSCAALVDRALTGRPVRGARYSFDVNHRPGLWPPERAAPVLARLAGRADVVFVGLDEAGRLWGTRTPDQVRALLSVPDVLVVKDGPVGATSYGPAGTTFVPALRVDVVEPVGAGDAFAAGYLSGLLQDLPEPARLRLGHLVATAALRVTGDVGPLPPADELAAAGLGQSGSSGTVRPWSRPSSAARVTPTSRTGPASPTPQRYADT
jgi:2-dehydro-3-deoxygluconokinase